MWETAAHLKFSTFVTDCSNLLYLSSDIEAMQTGISWLRYLWESRLELREWCSRQIQGFEEQVPPVNVHQTNNNCRTRYFIRTGKRLSKPSASASASKQAPLAEEGPHRHSSLRRPWYSSTPLPSGSSIYGEVSPLSL